MDNTQHSTPLTVPSSKAMEASKTGAEGFRYDLKTLQQSREAVVAMGMSFDSHPFSESPEEGFYLGGDYYSFLRTLSIRVNIPRYVG